MRKFWTVRPNGGYGVGVKNGRSNYPDFPSLVGTREALIPGDIRVMEPTAGAGNHNHLIMGSIGLPSSEAADDHYHWIIPKPGGGVRQVYIGAGTPHNHTGELMAHRGAQDYVQPKFYLVLVTCDEAEYAHLTSNGVVNVAERPGIEVDDGEGGTKWVYSPLSTTTWGAGKTNAVTNWLHNQLGLQRPDIVDDDKSLIVWLLDIAGWRPEQEDKHI